MLTCIGCGAMGRQERCGGNCSEHKLELVSGDDHHALVRAAQDARERAARLAPVARDLAGAAVRPADAHDALLRLRDSARHALREVTPEGPPGQWAEPGTVTGWWCARCGNVDMPQPCIGVCIWRPAEWVSLASYERTHHRAEPQLRTARRLTGLLTRLAAVTPRPGQWERNWDALREQARAALADFVPETPDLEVPQQRPQPHEEPPVLVYPWPR